MNDVMPSSDPALPQSDSHKNPEWRDWLRLRGEGSIGSGTPITAGALRLANVGSISALWLLAAAMLLALPFIYATTFYDVMVFDDEGTLMITFRDLMEGSRLYNDTYALYGPFYYLTIGGLFTTLHLPLTHDVVRLVAAGFWAACTMVFTGLTYLLTRSLIVGSVAFVTALVALRDFSHSPTHPEEICMLLLGCIPYLLYRIEHGALRAPLAAIGAIIAALVLTKINLGVFVAIALALVLLRISGRGFWLGFGFAAAAIAGAVLPLALMLPLFKFSWVINYCVFATITILSAILVWWRTQTPLLLTPRDWLVALSAAAITAIVTIFIVLLGGTTPYAMLDAVVLQNRHFIQNWYLPTWFGIWGAGAMIIGGALALAYVRFGTRSATSDLLQQAVGWTKLALGLAGIAFICVSYIAHALEPQMFLFRILEPFCWLLIVPPRAGQPGLTVTRAGIGLLAAFMVLYPFPVAGSQMNDATLLLFIMLPVLVHDGMTDLPLGWWSRRWALGNSRARSVLISCLIVGGVLLSPTAYALADFVSGVPLGLPGARLIHADPKTAAAHRWATQELSKCGVFYTLPGQLSFYFWTGKPTPTRINNNDTLGLLTRSQQEHVVAELSGHSVRCILTVPSLQKTFDRGQVAAHPPLLRYIENNFNPVAARAPYALLKRKRG